MSCPDDERIAAFMDGQLGPAVARQIEAHVDECVSCTRLLAELGKAYGPSASRAASLTAALREHEPKTNRPLLVVVHWSLWSIHVVTLVAMGVLSMLLARTDANLFVTVAERVTSFGSIYLAYLVAWSMLGLVVAPLCARGVSLDAAWARDVMRWFAYASLPSVVGTGHGLYTLRLLGEERRAPFLDRSD